ncbi:MAG: CAAX prenyl protease-related protein [bacterium]|nr:CAAX prenyl protease-related protein [bacterium]
MHAGNGSTSLAPSPSPPDWVDRIARRWPEAPLIAPFFTFLALMALAGVFDEAYKPWLYALRTFGALFVALAFRRYWPPLGKLYLHWCLLVGLIVAVGWVVIHKWFAGGVVAGQYVFDGFDWYSLSQIAGKDPTPEEYYVPHQQLGTGLAYWAFLIVRIGGAATVVPIVEELFWRGFVLRVLIDWHRFEDVPLGKFTWFSFVVCSLGSALEHPQWEVGILCWVAYNLLFYHTKSLLCLMVTHGITNLVLYVYVVRYEDWVFW